MAKLSGIEARATISSVRKNISVSSVTVRKAYAGIAGAEVIQITLAGRGS
jgi:hypothetical protein